ncbi:outer membrane lipoprotein carrier protein LolA [Pseudoalteromonas sp. MMG010]|uniref:outer membrane lipoprotein carrier protein LolA n=1 Tax=Pseudoalteromonas sp. MMG010 TaxID=2822685 RepID=UPI001B39EECB|nr:outer membrane lipoprotein carrier protein LolA [Pseudoalteromonas sp. MMG010]MBQ4833473.1 outer membrane lipoprotein carrier protein LolA [Pseudoalteromonas sp. MMG010]
MYKLFNFLLVLTALSTVVQAKSTDVDLNQFTINDSVWQFEQQKKFTFLKRKIKSTGNFILYDAQVYWHTLTPLESEMLLLAQGIYRRDANEARYQLVTKEQRFNQLLAKLLSGRIASQDWQITPQDVATCIELKPIDTQILNLFETVLLCAEGETQRQIMITDQQKNQTTITMTLKSKALTQNEMDKVKLAQ